MITWMQKHRKYLVVTIWISTIAFVGAGFVGWGSYNYGSLSANVATVGKVNITRDEFSTAYSQIFNNYNKMLGGKLGEKEAKEMGIEKMAMQSLIQQALLENFAKEIELQVSDEEVANKIAQIRDFQTNGVFDKQKYLNVLKENRIKSNIYEAGLKKYLLIQRVSAFVRPKVNELESKAIANASFGADKIEIKILKLSDIKVALTEDEIKTYWEKNKNNFQSKPSYDLEIASVKASEFKNSEEELKKAFAEYGSNFKEQNGTEMSYAKAKPLVNEQESKRKAKKEALKRFIALKNGELKGVKISKASIDNPSFPVEFAQELYKLTSAGNIKPIETTDGFVFANVSQVYKAEPLAYEAAKPAVTEMLKKERALVKLKELAKEETTKGFKGADVGYITKSDSKRLLFLAPDESQKFLSELFTSKNDTGFVVFADKAVLYKISEQKLLSSEEIATKNEFLNANILPFKVSVISEGLLDNLKKRYEVKINMEALKN